MTPTVRPAPTRSASALARELLGASRPFSWIDTAFPFVAAAFGASGRIDAAVVAGFLYFLFPYNLLLYGVNDLHDYESDVANPRKGSIEGSLVPPARGRLLWSAILVTNVPLLLLIGWLSGPVALAALGLTALVAWVYSAPPLRTKERPFLDSLTSALHFALPAVCGFLVADPSLTAIPWALVGAFIAWGMASHALGAIQDIAYDRAAGIGSIATALGARPTAWFSLVGYAIAVLVTAEQGPAGAFAGAWLALYLLLPVMVLARPDELGARRAWRGFLGLDLLVGFVLSHLLLRLWGVTTFSGPELLVMLGLVPAGIALVMIASTWLATRRTGRTGRPAGPGPLTRGDGAAGETVTVVIPARNEAPRLPATLAAVRALADAGVGILVVDDGSTDDTAAVARAALGDRGTVLTAPPVPSGWGGKGWTAWVGANAATTDHVLFLDADTHLAPGALGVLMAAAREGADLVSGVTAYAMPTRVERALMPGFPMLLFGFLPLGLLARTRGRPRAAAFAYGPLMLVRRAVYLELGGHRAIASSSREDIDLARLFAAAGRPVALVHGADLGTTRHYPTWRQVAGAWRRILFAYSGESLAMSITEIIGFGLAWGLPMLLPLAGLAGGDPLLLSGGLAALALMVAARLLLAVTQRQPLASVAWHPVTVGATLALQVAGLGAEIAGRPREWHGRELPAVLPGRPAPAVAAAAAPGTADRPGVPSARPDVRAGGAPGGMR